MKTIYITLLITLFSLSITAQEQQLSIEKIRKQQLDFFTKELNLTQEESTKMSPLINAYMDDRFKLFHEKPRKTSPMSEVEYKQAIEEIFEIKTKELELQKKYFQDLLKIMPAEKVFRYPFVEKKYMKTVIKKHEHKEEQKE